MKELNITCFIITAVTLVFMGIFINVIPSITRKAFLFGVRVPEKVHAFPEVKRLKKNYYWIVSIFMAALLLLSILQYLYLPDMSILACLYLTLTAALAQLAGFIPQWKKAKALKEENGWDVPAIASMETSSAVARQKLKGIPTGWYVFSIALCFICILYSYIIYPEIPDKIVTNWDLNMIPTAYNDKTLFTVMLLPLICLGTIGIMIASNFGIYKMKLQVSDENPALSFAQHRVYRRIMSHMLGLITMIITVFLLMLQPMSLNVFIVSGTVIMIATGVLLPAIIVPAIWIVLKVGQGGCKLKPEITGADVSAAGNGCRAEVFTSDIHRARSDDQYWKLGLFYYNPEDPAIMVEDRFGTNGGFNYARPVAKILAAACILMVIVVYIMMTVLYFTGKLN